MQRIPLGFVRRAPPGHRRRGASATLNLVSFIDFLVVTVIFLLMSFSASGECPAAERKLPSAENVMDAIDAPLVMVNTQQILVDGVYAGSARDSIEGGPARKVEALFTLLKQKRDLWKQVQPNKVFPGTCVLAIDQDVSAAVVKSVFQTAALAGYPNVSFLVRKIPPHAG